jgi:hypothetical protein
MPQKESTSTIQPIVHAQPAPKPTSNAHHFPKRPHIVPLDYYNAFIAMFAALFHPVTAIIAISSSSYAAILDTSPSIL